jgi:hypothetical protein
MHVDTNVHVHTGFVWTHVDTNVHVHTGYIQADAAKNQAYIRMQSSRHIAFMYVHEPNLILSAGANVR